MWENISNRSFRKLKISVFSFQTLPSENQNKKRMWFTALFCFENQNISPGFLGLNFFLIFNYFGKKKKKVSVGSFSQICFINSLKYVLMMYMSVFKIII